MTQEEVDSMIEAIEAPCGIRIEKQIREAMESESGVAASPIGLDGERESYKA